MFAEFDNFVTYVSQQQTKRGSCSGNLNKFTCYKWRINPTKKSKHYKNQLKFVVPIFFLVLIWNMVQNKVMFLIYISGVCHVGLFDKMPLNMDNTLWPIFTAKTEKGTYLSFQKWFFSRVGRDLFVWLKSNKRTLGDQWCQLAIMRFLLSCSVSTNTSLLVYKLVFHYLGY